MDATRHRNNIPRDGYTEPGYLAPERHLFDWPLRFKFRPVLPEERAEHLEAIDKINSAVKNQLACNAFIASRLVEWDDRDEEGNVNPITPVTVGRLKPTLSNRLYEIILGVRPSDCDPEWSDAVKREQVDAEYQSAKFNKPIGTVKLEESEKN